MVPQLKLRLELIRRCRQRFDKKRCPECGDLVILDAFSDDRFHSDERAGLVGVDASAHCAGCGHRLMMTICVMLDPEPDVKEEQPCIAT